MIDGRVRVEKGFTKHLKRSPMDYTLPSSEAIDCLALEHTNIKRLKLKILPFVSVILECICFRGTPEVI